MAISSDKWQDEFNTAVAKARANRTKDLGLRESAETGRNNQRIAGDNRRAGLQAQTAARGMESAERMNDKNIVSAEGISANSLKANSANTADTIASAERMQGLSLGAAKDLNRSNFAQDYTLAGGKGGNSIDPFSGINYSGLRVPTPPSRPNTTLFKGSLDPNSGLKPGIVNLDNGVYQPLRDPTNLEQQLKDLKDKNARDYSDYGN